MNDNTILFALFIVAAITTLIAATLSLILRYHEKHKRMSPAITKQYIDDTAEKCRNLPISEYGKFKCIVRIFNGPNVYFDYLNQAEEFSRILSNAGCLTGIIPDNRNITYSNASDLLNKGNIKMTDAELENLIKEEGIDRVKNAIRSIESEDRVLKLIKKNNEDFEALHTKYPNLTKELFEQIRHNVSKIRMNTLSGVYCEDEVRSKKAENDFFSLTETLKKGGFSPQVILDYQKLSHGESI